MTFLCLMSFWRENKPPTRLGYLPVITFPPSFPSAFARVKLLFHIPLREQTKGDWVWVWAKCVSSDFLNEKVLMILTCIILKIKAQLKQLVNWKLWVILFYLDFDKICIFHEHLRSSCSAERIFVKKIYRSEFLQSSFISVIYLFKEVYRKIMSKIHFVDKTRYEDLTETGSFENMVMYICI